MLSGIRPASSTMRSRTPAASGLGGGRGRDEGVEQVADEDEQGGGVPAAEVLLGPGQRSGAAVHVADDDEALVAPGDVGLDDRVEPSHLVQVDEALGDGGRPGPHPGGDIHHDPGLDVVECAAAGLVALDQFVVGQLPLDVDNVDLVAAAPCQGSELAVTPARRVGAVEQHSAALTDPGGHGGLERRDDLLFRSEGHRQGGHAVQIREGRGVQAAEIVQADGEITQAMPTSNDPPTSAS